MEETKLTATLPTMDIEIVHRDDPERGAEIIAVQIRATPSFDALRGLLAPPAFLPTAFLPTSIPAAAPAMLPLLAPMQAWTELVRQAWAPWLRLLPAPHATGRDGDTPGR